MSDKTFIVRDTPAWLLTSQDWISDGARGLYNVLCVLANKKSGGRLFIPGKGWIKLRTIEKKAGMCRKTRIKYMRELKALGGFAPNYDYVIRTIKGRKRKVRGEVQITVLPLKPPKPHGYRGSTTGQNSEKQTPEPQDGVSTTGQSTTGQAENILLQGKSCPGQGLPQQVLSENTTTQGAAAALAKDQSFPARARLKSLGVAGSSQTSPATNPLPNPPQNQTSARLENNESESDPDAYLGELIEQPEISNFWAHAHRNGWKKADVQGYLKQNFDCVSPNHLTLREYWIALKHVHKPPRFYVQ